MLADATVQELTGAQKILAPCGTTDASGKSTIVVFYCEAISSVADHENMMPRRLSLMRKTADGNEIRAEYVQVS